MMMIIKYSFILVGIAAAAAAPVPSLERVCECGVTGESSGCRTLTSLEGGNTTTGTPDDNVCFGKGRVTTQLNFFESTIKENELQFGDGNSVIRYENIGFVNEKPIDFVVKVVGGTTYDSERVLENVEHSNVEHPNVKSLGGEGKFGTINVQQLLDNNQLNDGEVDLEFCLYDHANREELVTVDSFRFSIVNLDQGYGLREEIIMGTTEIEDFILHPESGIELSCEDGSTTYPCDSCVRTVFRPTTVGIGPETPTDPNDLDELQQKHTIVFSFRYTSCFTMTLHHYCPVDSSPCENYGGGNFLFTGDVNQVIEEGTCVQSPDRHCHVVNAQPSVVESESPTSSPPKDPPKSSTISGGENNKASGSYSSIGGGFENLAEGFSSVVIGGSGNQAIGQHSIAMGNNAIAKEDQSLVINLGKEPVESTEMGEFLVNSRSFTISILKKEATINTDNIDNLNELLKNKSVLRLEQIDEQQAIIKELQETIDKQQATNEDKIDNLYNLFKNKPGQPLELIDKQQAIIEELQGKIYEQQATNKKNIDNLYLQLKNKSVQPLEQIKINEKQAIIEELLENIVEQQATNKDDIYVLNRLLEDKSVPCLEQINKQKTIIEELQEKIDKQQATNEGNINSLYLHLLVYKSVPHLEQINEQQAIIEELLEKIDEQQATNKNNVDNLYHLLKNKSVQRLEQIDKQQTIIEELQGQNKKQDERINEQDIRMEDLRKQNEKLDRTMTDFIVHQEDDKE